MKNWTPLDLQQLTEYWEKGDVVNASKYLEANSPLSESMASLTPRKLPATPDPSSSAASAKAPQAPTRMVVLPPALVSNPSDALSKMFSVGLDSLKAEYDSQGNSKQATWQLGLKEMKNTTARSTKTEQHLHLIAKVFENIKAAGSRLSDQEKALRAYAILKHIRDEAHDQGNKGFDPKMDKLCNAKMKQLEENYPMYLEANKSKLEIIANELRQAPSQQPKHVEPPHSSGLDESVH
ncbi:MAG: hypothetical protein ACHQJ6_03400 [Candidatus Berkiellales bacterium]